MLPIGRGTSERKVTITDLESVLERDLADTGGARVESVDCPGANAESRDGLEIDCTLALPDGQTATTRVTFTDAAGSLSYEIPAGEFRQAAPGGVRR